MKHITHQGEFDHLFIDDRDVFAEEEPSSAQIPTYGRNTLKKPRRPPTAKEAGIIDAIGLPVKPAPE